MLLEVLSPSGKASTIPLDADSIDVGSGDACRVRLAGASVARSHARISRHADTGKYFILDLGSAWGTAVNGESVVRYGPLGDADVIAIGSHQLKVLSHAARPVPEAATPKAAVIAPQPAPAPRPEPPGKSIGAAIDLDPQLAEMAVLAEQIHQALFVVLDLRRNDVNRMNDAELRELTQRLIGETLDRGGFPAHIDRVKLAAHVLNEAVGLGALESLIADESISEIMVNGPRDVFVERHGRLQRAPRGLQQRQDTVPRHRAHRHAARPAHRRVLTAGRCAPARTARASTPSFRRSRSRGRRITIRKFSKRRLEAGDLVGFGAVNAQMVEFLDVCVEQKKNIVISGGTGSGKTTLLNVLSSLIPTARAHRHHRGRRRAAAASDHVVSLETRPANIEGKGAVTIRDLVKNALRMRPDRIVVGECRGGEALDMLQAMNTGHDGSLTTTHANSPREALSRLETMVLMAGIDLPSRAIREQIASAVHVIVQQTRFADGSRKITRIAEITGIDHGTIQMQELFRFERTGFDANGKIQGYFTGCGQIPTFYEEVQRAGVPLELAVFSKRDAQGDPC